MTLAALLAEADALGLGLISWRPRAQGWACFASRAPVPCVAEGRTARDALAELVRFVRAVR